MRYFAELAYQGTPYIGWQKQPKGKSIQSSIEKALSTILRQSIEVVGCGRTDAGVHAKQYFLHFDYDQPLPDSLLSRINKMLAKDIAFRQFIAVDQQAHARFDATHRAYEYHLDFNKNPFQINTIFHYPLAHRLDIDRMQHAVKALLEYEEFFPFCKSNTDVKTMKCQLFRSEWVVDCEQQKMVFHISANRFLRGMVRLIVGMSLNVGLGKVREEEVRMALTKQDRLSKSWSVPPHGLFLTDIKYPFLGQE